MSVTNIRLLGPSRTPYRDHYAKLLEGLRSPAAGRPTPYRDGVRRWLDMQRLPVLSDVQIRQLMAGRMWRVTPLHAIGEVSIDGVRYRVPGGAPLP